MKEFIPAICWKSFCAKNISHANNLNDMGFKALRIFINLADFPQGTPSQAYIEKIMNLQDGKWAWDGFSKNWWSSAVNEKVKDAFDFCKKYNWLPIVCFGHSEEQSSWITRSPSSDKWSWLFQMAMQFASYLNNMGFARADIEVWNEPNECMSAAHYGQVAIHMIRGWKSVNANYKSHVFASNITQQGYLDALLGNGELMKVTDYISPHCISFDEWDSDLINITYNKVTAKGKKVSLLEISPLGDMNRLNKIIGKCDMYGLVLIIRNSLIGTAFDIDDFLVYDFDNPDHFIAVTTYKMQWIKEFNKKYYIPYEVTEDDMKLDKVYKIGSRGIGVKFIQMCLNKDIEIDLVKPLVVDGIFGTKTAEALKDYQQSYNLTVDGMAGQQTFKVMIFNNPEIWDELQYLWSIGER
jgi:peptidoglycan hydrolase-like protein with peptidoglycan-binding domain